MTNVVTLENLTHLYGKTSVLKNVSLAVLKGQIFGLLGPNGGGKTTLFKILSTLLKPTSGKAMVSAFDVRLSAKHVRRKIGVVFQNPSLDKKLTLRENLVHQGHLHELKGSDLSDRIDHVLAIFKLTDRQNDLVEKLSGGLQRRGEIAKGLLHKPDILLMDEPTTGLDPLARRDVWDYLSILKQEGITILLTTHLIEEAERCDQIAILHQGVLVTQGTPAELKKKIGGDVITVQTFDAHIVPGKIESKLKEMGLTVQADHNTLRIEKPDGYHFIPQLVEWFPGCIKTVTVGSPTLEDVFIHETGQKL